MTLPKIDKLYEVIEATWPAARCWNEGAFQLRDGQGGGKRVSAATAMSETSKDNLTLAETAMQGMGQTPLFQIREGDGALDDQLHKRGYQIVDPVNVYAAQASAIATERPARTVAIPAWEPLQIMEEIWGEGGIGPERIAVMHRACDPKTGIISRLNDKPAGTSFVAMYDGISMLHALEILPEMRRNRLAHAAMRQAAFWTLDQGGHTLSVVVTKENIAANRLYSELGMTLIGQYHYRQKPDSKPTT